MFSLQSKQIPQHSTPTATEDKLDTYDIRNYQPIDIANELTLINRNLLLRIKPAELFDFAFLSSKKELLAPNITVMLNFHNRILLLFATQILQQKTDKLRASVMIHLFSIIQQLYIKNHDIHSIRIILAAFDQPSVFRLRETWRIFRREHPQFFTALKHLWSVLSQENNWQDYRLWLEEKFIKDCLNTRQPMLLFIGYLLSKMIIDRYRFYNISPTHYEKEISSRVNKTLIEYIQSSPRHILLLKKNKSLN